MIRPLACLLTLLIAQPAASEALRPFTPPKTGAEAPDDAAIVIGIARYTDLAPVPFADADARLFHQLLLDTIGVPTSRISNLHAKAAPREIIRAEVKRLAGKATGTLWIYFAGHGASTKDGDALLIGRDATPNNLQARSVRRSELIKWTQASKAKRIVIVLDACFAGKDRAGKALTGQRFSGAAALVAAPRVVVWSGTTGVQTAWPLAKVRHGLFTWFAVGALAGWAADSQGKVTLGRASAWVAEAMATAQGVLQRDQTPTTSGPAGWATWPVAAIRKAPPAPDLRAWSLAGPKTPPGSGGVEFHYGGGADISELAAEVAAREAAEEEAARRRAEAERKLKAARKDALSKAEAELQARAARDFRAIRNFVEHPRPAGRPVLQAFVKRYMDAKVSIDGVERAVHIEGLAAVRAALGVGTSDSRFRPKLVSIRSGSFTMGSPEDEEGRYGDETERSVRVGAFEVMTTEVTQAQYAALMGTNPSYNSKCADCPVEQVTWYDAVKYANALSKTEHLSPCYGTLVPGCDGYRLPTEAEWEYAARAGTTSARYGMLNTVAWWTKNTETTQPVGRKAPNAWGLYDMLGNVHEWCGGKEGGLHVIRGGSFSSGARGVRAAFRDTDIPNFRGRLLGFRLVRRPRAN